MPPGVLFVYDVSRYGKDVRRMTNRLGNYNLILRAGDILWHYLSKLRRDFVGAESIGPQAND